MIQNYIKQMPKWKIVAFVLCMLYLVVILTTTRVHSGPIFDWITSTFVQTDNITDEIAESMDQSLAEFMQKGIPGILIKLSSDFGPDLSTFNKYTGGSAVWIRRAGIFFGVFTSTVIFFFSLFAYFFNGKVTDSKDTPVSLGARYLVAMGICLLSQKIIVTFIYYYKEIHNALMDSCSIGEAETEMLALSEMTSNENTVSYSLFGPTIAITFAKYPLLLLSLLIFELFLYWKLFKGLIQMFLELISRYIASVIFLCLMPAFAGTIISNNTSQIFKSYLRVLFSSFMLLTFNELWFLICMYAFGNADVIESPIEYLILLELCHFGTKFDNMLRSMGLSVATGASSLGRAISGAGRNVANSLRNANEARKSGGALLKAAGIATGSQAMFDAGSKIGASAVDIATGKAAGGTKAFMEAMAESGRIGNYTPNQSANALMDYMSPNATNTERKIGGNLTDQQLKDGAQQILGGGYKVDNVQRASIRTPGGGMANGLTVSGTSETFDPKTRKTSHVPFTMQMAHESAFLSSKPIVDGKGASIGGLGMNNISTPLKGDQMISQEGKKNGQGTGRPSNKQLESFLSTPSAKAVEQSGMLEIGDKITCLGNNSGYTSSRIEGMRPDENGESSLTTIGTVIEDQNGNAWFTPEADPNSVLNSAWDRNSDNTYNTTDDGDRVPITGGDGKDTMYDRMYDAFAERGMDMQCIDDIGNGRYSAEVSWLDNDGNEHSRRYELEDMGAFGEDGRGHGPDDFMVEDEDGHAFKAILAKPSSSGSKGSGKGKGSVKDQDAGK